MHVSYGDRDVYLPDCAWRQLYPAINYASNLHEVVKQKVRLLTLGHILTAYDMISSMGPSPTGPVCVQFFCNSTLQTNKSSSLEEHSDELN